MPKPTSRLFPFRSGAGVGRSSRGQHLTYARGVEWLDRTPGGSGRGREWQNGRVWSVGAWVAVLLLVLCSGAVELASTAANLELR